MKQIKNNLIFLKAVSELYKKQRKHLLKHASKEQINALAEISANVLDPELKLFSKTDKLHLRAYKRVIRALASKGISDKERQRIAVSNNRAVALLLTITLKKLAAQLK